MCVSGTGALLPFIQKIAGLTNNKSQLIAWIQLKLKDQGSNPPTPNPTSTIFPPFQSVMPVTKSYCSGGYISTGVTAKVHALGCAKVGFSDIRVRGCLLRAGRPRIQETYRVNFEKKEGVTGEGKCFTKKCVCFFVASFFVSCKTCSL